MATQKGVWDLQEVRDKQLASEWSYAGADPGHLFMWGNNGEGQLGQSDLANRSSPIQVPGVWQYLSCSKKVLAGIKSDGTLWTWCENGQGQLGLNDRTERSSPCQVGTNPDWAMVRSNHDGHIAAVKTDGTIWSWGANTYQHRGPNPATKYSSPTQVWDGTNWGQAADNLAIGPGNIGAVKTDGTLWLWGRNFGGSAGQNDTTTPFTSPKQVGTNTNWTSMGGQQGIIGTAGGFSIKALKNDGTMWVWGSNNKGQAGLNYEDSGISSPIQLPGTTWTSRLTGGGSGCLHIKTDGTLWSWGYQYNGSLGLNQGGPVSTSSPAQVGTDTTWYNVAQTENMVAIKTDGTLWACGGNPGGCLGQNDTAAVSSPVQIPGTWITQGLVGSFDNVCAALKYT